MARSSEAIIGPTPLGGVPVLDGLELLQRADYRRKAEPRFLAKMEDVLAVYLRPPDPRRPWVCLDEKGKELHTALPDHQPLPARPQPGQRQRRQDYEYQRAGSAKLFLLTAPLQGWRRVAVTADRTAPTFAEQLRQLVEEDFPEVEKIVLVSDNLNTHNPGSLYKAFPAEQAFRIAQKLEWHLTPEHGVLAQHGRSRVVGVEATVFTAPVSG